MDQKDLHLYKSLVSLGKKQLASIERRISHRKPAKWDEFFFKLRHAKIKKILLNILTRREASEGERAVLGMIEDFKAIAADNEKWRDAEERVTDYLRFVLHGVRSAPENTGGEKGKTCNSDGT